MNEEEKKIIKKFVEKCNKFDESVEIKGVSVGEEYRILETVCKTLDLVEKLQKENEEFEEINNKLEAEKNEAIRRYNFETIPIKKIKDKIEELNKAYEDSKDENGESEYYYPDYTIRVLEELLESE